MRDRVSAADKAAEQREVTMAPRILARNAVEAAALRYIESLVPAAERIPAQGRHARRGRYFASGRPAFRRPAIA